MCYMAGFERPGRSRSEGESLGDILRGARETALGFFSSKPTGRNEGSAERVGPRVVDGVLDISSLSNEDLTSVEGIAAGVILNGVDVLYPSDIRTTREAPYLLPRKGIGRVEINGRYLAIDRRQNPNLPTNEGLNNFVITGVDGEYIYLSALEDSTEALLPKPETLEVRNNTIDLSSYAGGPDQSYEVPSLAIGQTLKEVFIRPDNVSSDSGRLPLRINNKSVRLYRTFLIPDEADYFNLEILGITGEDIYVQTVKEKDELPETPLVENGAIKIAGLDLPRVYTGPNEEPNYLSEGVEVGTVIKNVFLYECAKSARQYFNINGNKVYIEKGGVDVDGVYDVRVLKISFSNEYIDLEVLPAAGAEQRIFAVKDGMVEIPELSKRIEFTEDEGRPDFEVDGLGEGVVLRNLFLDRDTYYQAFELNGQNVYLAGQTPSEAGNYDVVVDQIAPGSVDVRIVKRSEQSQKSEVPTVKDGEVSIPGLELPRPDSYTNSEYSIEGLKEGIVIKNVFLKQCDLSEKQYFLLNRKRVFVENTPVQSDGVYDVRVVTINSEEGSNYIDIEIVSESEVAEQQEVFTVKDGELEIPQLSKRLDLRGGVSVEINVDRLVRGVVLKNVFLSKNSVSQPFRLNGRRVDIPEGVPNEDGNYDIKVTVVGRVPANYVEFRIVGKLETSTQDAEKTSTNPESGKSIEIGSVVENVVFRKRSDGTYVSANPDGKAFLFESVGFGRPRAVAVGAPVNVRIIRDTKPGKSDGFYIVRYESAAETERQPESLQVRNGEVNLANVYSGQETDIIVRGLTEGVILSDLRVRPGDDNQFFSGA